MQEIKKQILSRLSLMTLIGEAVSLQKRGNFATGLCPFHEENTPSFYVYEDHYHCYGCGEHGDAISYVRKVQGLSFMDSLRWLADKAGISLSATEEDKKYAGEWKKKARENQILLAAKDFFCSQFKDPFQGKFARAYWETRKISQEICEEWGIGCAPAFPDALWKHLKTLGFRSEELAASSLVNQGRDRVYDFFQNRLIIPIRDEQSRIIAFTGRSLGDELPKYKNSRFEKGSFLFGLDRARNGIRQKSRAIIVEGHFDALQMWNHGLNETVACQGTALTHDHLRKLSAFTRQIILIFDGDRAGHKAALKTLDQAFNFPEVYFKVALLPPQEDPDSLLRTKGREALDSLLEKAEDLLDFAIRDRLQNAPQTGLAETLSQSIFPWLQQVSDPLRRAVLLQKVAQHTGLPQEVLKKSMDGVKAKAPQPWDGANPKTEIPEIPKGESEHLSTLEKEFMGHLYYAQAHQVSLEDIDELIREYMDLGGVWVDFANELLETLKKGESPDSKDQNFWITIYHPMIKAFLDEIRDRKSAFHQVSGDMSPWTRLRLEARKKRFRKTLELLKQKIISLKVQKIEDPELWGHLTHSLMRTTQELESVDNILRRRLSQSSSNKTAEAH